MITDIATGEKQDPAHKAEGQQRGGQIGGKVRAERLSPEERSAIARKAAAKRWKR